MRRERALYLATFGSMTAAAAVVIALIILGGGGDDPRVDGGKSVAVVVAGQDIAAGTQISAEMLMVADMRRNCSSPMPYGTPRR
jgi:hypothetical protein